MQFLNDERAENPLEVGIYLLVVLLVMAFLMMTVGAFMDEFVVLISGINITLSSWGQDRMTTYLGYVDYIYAVPTIFIIIVMIWGVKSIIKRQTLSATDPQYINYQEEY